MKRLCGVALVLGVLGGCGPLGRFLPGQSGFDGNVASTPFVYEPTGTVFSWLDGLGPTPALVDRLSATRVVIFGSYAFFDASQDLNRSSGSDLQDLRHEIENSDWILIEVGNAQEPTTLKGKSFDAIVVRDSFDDIYRLQQGTDPNIKVRARFGRQALGRNAAYSCGSNVPGCSPYKPLGGKLTVKVTFDEVNPVRNGSFTVTVAMDIEKNGDEGDNDVRTGSVDGTLRAAFIEERTSEVNFKTLDLYELTGLSE